MRFRLRTILIAVTVIGVLFAIASRIHQKHVGPAWTSSAIREDLYKLVDRRPDNMTARQWESAVAWTLNLHGNSLLQFQTPLGDITEFKRELDDRLKGPVDMSTIHWIWDRYGGLCAGGKNYQRFRPQMDDEILKGGGNWGLQVP